MALVGEDTGQLYFVGGGRRSYTTDTQYRYIGAGAGEFDYVKPAPTYSICICFSVGLAVVSSACIAYSMRSHLPFQAQAVQARMKPLPERTKADMEECVFEAKDPCPDLMKIGGYFCPSKNICQDTITGLIKGCPRSCFFNALVTAAPTAEPTSAPTPEPKATPTAPTAEPTSAPTPEPKATPTAAPDDWLVHHGGVFIQRQPFMVVNCHSRATGHVTALPSNFTFISYTDLEAPLRVVDATDAINKMMYNQGKKLPLEVGTFKIKAAVGAEVPDYRCEGESKFQTAIYESKWGTMWPREHIKDGQCWRLNELVAFAKKSNVWALVMLACKVKDDAVTAEADFSSSNRGCTAITGQ